ncbi:MAG TPA: hypothetical protein VNL39_12055 [Xanthobacteraceae bacterium]|nr:hypothetical protein [Xanthobacteraceae bacterium]
MRRIVWTTSILIAYAFLWLIVSEFYPATAQGRSGKATASRMVTGSWIHNGSVMSLVTDGKTQKFIYYTPRIGLLDAGVKPGTLLFEGRRTGQIFVGTAYQFYRTCKPRGFRVSGTASEDQKQITLKGKAPLLDVNCKVSGTRDEVLVFTANPAPPGELAAESKAGAAPVANTAGRVASRTPANEPASERAEASKSEETRAPEAPVVEASKAKTEETPSRTTSTATAKMQADAANYKPSAPTAESTDARVAPESTQAAQTGAAPETSVAAVAAKNNQSTAPAGAAETTKPDAEKTGASPKLSGDAAQAELGQVKPPAAADSAKDSAETAAANKTKTEGPAVADQTQPKGTEATAGTTPSHQPQKPAQTEPTETKVAATTARGGDSSQGDDPGKVKVAAREVAAEPNETAKQDGANSAAVPSQQGVVAPPQVESASTKMGGTSPAFVASTNNDDASKAKVIDGKMAGSLQSALKPSPSNADGDRTGALGENENKSKSAGSSESKAAAPVAAEKMMEIVLKNGRILRIGRDVDLEVLARIVTMLER